MNTMLELSMDANYDIIAASVIFVSAIAAKLWFNYADRARKTQA